MEEKLCDEQLHKKRDLKQKCGAFFDRNYALFFAPIIVLVAYLAALFAYDVYPFSEKYTAASYDLSAQICPFIEHLFDVTQGKSSLTYSYAITGGTDVVGTFLYFFISPFSFVFLIFGDGKVAYASSIVMALKLATISVSGTWFAKKLFNGIPDYICIVIGVAYAYCGYTFVANTYINWMDFLIWLPFAAGAFGRFVKTGGFWRFSVLVACCIYTCFSIACFSMFVAFPTLICYGLLCVEKKDRNAFLAKLCLAFAVAVLIALPVLLPALSAYMRSARGGGLFDNFWFGFTVSESGEIKDFSSSAFIATAEDAAYRKWSYILADMVFVVLTLVWFCRKGLRDPFAKFMLVAGVTTLLPVAVDEAMLLMNMGSYMSYALRFGFLNALYFLGGACLALEGFCYRLDRAYDNVPLKPLRVVALPTVETENMENDGGRYALKERLGGSLGWIIAFTLVCVGALAFLIWFISAGNYKTIWEDVVENSIWKENLHSFSSRFAHSLGGAEVIGVFFVVVGAVITFGVVLARRKKFGLKFLSYLLIVIVGVQVLFYNNQIVLGNRSTQHVDLGAYETLCAQLNEMNTDEDGEIAHFRVKDYGDKLTAPAPFTGNSHSFSVFSSVIDRDNFIIGELFGYNGNYKNSLKSSHRAGKANKCEVFGDAFLGYKYFVVHEEQKASVESDPTLEKYLKPVTVGSEQLKEGDFYAYENEVVFPSAYKVKGEAFRFVAPNEANGAYRQKNQAALFAFLRGKTLEEVNREVNGGNSSQVTVTTARELSEYLWAQSPSALEVSAGRIRAEVTAEAGESLFLNFVASKGYRVFVNGKEAKLIDNDLKFLCVALDEGENIVEFEYTSPYAAYLGVGALAAALGLCVVALVIKKTRLLQWTSLVIAWAGILLAAAVVAFFMIFPTAVGVVKLARLLL